MTVSYPSLLDYNIDTARYRVDADRAILYALSVGLGSDVKDPRALKFIYEPELTLLPTMLNVIAYPGFWPAKGDSGLHWQRILHTEQHLMFHQPVPVGTLCTSQSQIVDLYDRGIDKGLDIIVKREIRDADSNVLYGTIKEINRALDDGGGGGEWAAPERRPERLVDVPRRNFDLHDRVSTQLGQAALYRLCGDKNPLHIDPAVAAQAGFTQPILHGLCTFGVAACSLLRCVCDYETARIRSLSVRFTAPVVPGDTLDTRMWVQGDMVYFQTTAVERDVMVLNNGCLQLTPTNGVS